MQIMVIFFGIYGVQSKINTLYPETSPHDSKVEKEHAIIIYLLLFEHIMSYTFSIIRKRDIAHNGRPDHRGVIRA